MPKITFENILISLLLMSGGTVGGWALTEKLAGDDAASSFLQIGIGAVLAMSATQFLFFQRGKNRLIYRLLCGLALGCGLVWFLLCLLLPMLWVTTVGTTEKCFLFTFLIGISMASALKAARQFESKWRELGQAALSRNYNPKDGIINWPRVLAPMKFSIELYIPVLPEKATPFISVALVVSMLAGLSLRNAFPIFSLYAWGIPACMVISMFAQIIGLGIAQIAKLMALEKKYGKLIKPIN